MISSTFFTAYISCEISRKSPEKARLPRESEKAETLD
jgi:hypothetical protein